jgi:hypothetical protein
MKKFIDATSTPLASIFGSGFLVIVPILNGAVGPYSLPAMVGVCGLAYAVGSVIRFNIRNTEPFLESGKAPPAAILFERISDFALVLAYVISVCLYLRILSSFLLSGLGMDNDLHEQIVTTAAITTILLISVTKGLQALEMLEEWALWMTLVVIVAIFAGFIRYDYYAFTTSGIQWPAMPEHTWWQIATIVGGTLIVVQGFETSRYLSEEFDTETRIRSCRMSQIISTCVYIVFIALATPLMHFLGGRVQENGLIMLAGKASVLLTFPLVAAAVMSQFSAAVADTLGGEGNMVEASNQRIQSKAAYGIICGGAIILTWSADTIEILAIASRAFAFYYLLQCFVAISVSKKLSQKSGMILLAAVLAFITVFAVPAG